MEVSKSKETIGEVLNSASNFEISIKKTAELICELMNSQKNIISDEKRIRPEASEVNRLFGDNSRLKRLTNWEPTFSELDGFKKGLEKTIEWFSKSENLNFYNKDKYII